MRRELVASHLLLDGMVHVGEGFFVEADSGMTLDDARKSWKDNAPAVIRALRNGVDTMEVVSYRNSKSGDST